MTTTADFVIVGSGIAGLRAAIALAESGRVLVLTKADPSESNTGYAQGGIAAAVGPDDSSALHAADTIRAGDGLCDEPVVGVLVEEGPRYVRELVDWGARFDRDDHGELALGREAAHSVRRVLHAGDATGREIGRVLWERTSAAAVTTVNHALVTELIIDSGAACGVRFFDRTGVRQEVRAAATLLATGGAGRVFRETTNPPVATGDGIALAYHAGARVSDLEFVQFHPTALDVRGVPRFLISEALRGEGARLINARGEGFMQRLHPDGDLAPRDVVARGIAQEIEEIGGPVFLTLAHLDPGFVRKRFPTINEMCGRAGVDLARDRIPVGPAAHYMMGGVATDEWGRTSLQGLFAAGEVACTGVHGANRLASNSLLEGLVFGARAAGVMAGKTGTGVVSGDRLPAVDASNFRRNSAIEAEKRGRESVSIPDLMWQYAGLFRTRAGLAAAAAALEPIYAAALARTRGEDGSILDAWKALNLTTVARLIVRAALRREESRGAHSRADFPARDDLHWKIHVTESLGSYGENRQS